MTPITAQQERAARFRTLHEDFLTMPNVWDAGSAHLIAQAGAAAIATSSGAQSWAQGTPDGRSLTLAEVLVNLERIVSVVDVPVSADIENAYAHDAAGVGETVGEILAAGVVGVNIEDSGAADSTLYSAPAQASRIAAAREASTVHGIDMFINARTDVFLLAVGDEDTRLDEVIARARAYREAGADGLFVPGLLDPDALGTLARETGLKLNAMWLPGAPAPHVLKAAGVARYTAGTAIAQVAYTRARDAARAFLDGTDAAMTDSIDYFAFNAEFSD